MITEEDVTTEEVAADVEDVVEAAEEVTITTIVSITMSDTCPVHGGHKWRECFFMDTTTGRGQAIRAITTPRVKKRARGTVMPITMMEMIAVEEMAQTTPTIIILIAAK